MSVVFFASTDKNIADIYTCFCYAIQFLINFKHKTTSCIMAVVLICQPKWLPGDTKHVRHDVVYF